MQTLIKDYDYFLPPELVVQYPLAERDASRFLVLRRADSLPEAEWRAVIDAFYA